MHYKNKKFINQNILFFIKNAFSNWFLMTKYKNIIYVFVIIAELSLPLLGFFIFLIIKKPFSSVFLMKMNFFVQILYGTVLGICAGFLSAVLVDKIKNFKIIKELVMKIIKEYRINLFDITLISFLAGICEEILFRGVLQQLTGLFLSSFIFILLHGYFNPFNLNISIFGLFMYILSLIIGISFEYFGILSAIVFHFLYDFIVLYYFKKKSCSYGFK